MTTQPLPQIGGLAVERDANGVPMLVVKLDGTTTPVTIPGSVEISNDSGNPIPVVGLAQATVTATIDLGASLSAAVDLGDRRAVRLVMPAAFTGTTLTFQTSYDGVTFNDLYDEAGNVVSYTVAAARSVRLPIADWLGVRYLKIRAGTPSVPVVQAVARSIIIVAQ